MKSHPMRCLLFGLFLALSTPILGQSLLSHVPQDAFFLWSLHPDNLNRKVPLKELAALDVVQGLLDEVLGKTNNIRLALDDPAAYGLNLQSSSHLFVNQSPEDFGGGVLLSLTDVERFEQFLLEQFEEGYQPQDLPPGRFLFLDEGVGLAWTERFVLLAFQEARATDEDLDPALHHARFRNWVQELLRLPPERSLLARPHFRQVIEGSFDTQLWIDYEKLFEFLLQAGQSLPSLPGMGDPATEWSKKLILRMNQSRQQAVGISALDGKIEVVSRQFFAPPMRRLLAAANDSKWPRRFHRYLPGEDVLGYLALNLNTRALGEALKPLLADLLSELSPLGDKARSIVTLADLFLNEEALYDLFPGQMFLGVSGQVLSHRPVTLTDYDEEFNPIEKDTMVETRIPGVTLLIAYGNPQPLQTLLQMGVEWGVLEPAGSHFIAHLPGLELPIFLAAHKGVLFVTNDPNFVENHLERGLPRKLRLNKKHCRNLKENSSALYVNLGRVIERVLETEPGQAFQAMGPSELWNFPLLEVQFTSGREVEPTQRSVWELRFREKDQNALKQLLDYLNRLFLEFGGGGQKT